MQLKQVLHMFNMPDSDHTVLSRLILFWGCWSAKSSALLPSEFSTLHATEVQQLTASTHYVHN